MGEARAGGDDKPLPWPSIDWLKLDGCEPPKRRWAIRHWIPMGHVTMLAGPPGAGKTLIAQAMASCMALHREYIDQIPRQLKVLMWACEDDVEELWRRQLAIAQALEVNLSAFAGEFTLYSYDGRLVELAGVIDHQLVATPMLNELREQIGDFKADVVFLDNSARLYAGDENDRHQVTSFIAMLTGAARVRNAAVVLLAHPSKQTNSEYSGSTAWEGAVRTRLYLGRKLPDVKAKPNGEDEVEDDDTVRYICRRKSNYSARDYRRLQFVKGVLVPDEVPEASMKMKFTPELAREVLMRAVRRLADLDQYGVLRQSSEFYLPKLVRKYDLNEGLPDKQMVSAMVALQKEGLLKLIEVGKYAHNRTSRMGLTLTG